MTTVCDAPTGQSQDKIKRMIVAVKSIKLIVNLLEKLDKEHESGRITEQFEDEDFCLSEAGWIAEEYVDVLRQASSQKLLTRARNISKLLSEIMVDQVAIDPAVTSEDPTERTKGVLELLSAATDLKL